MGGLNYVEATEDFLQNFKMGLGGGEVKIKWHFVTLEIQP